MFSSYKVINCP
ncbi:hypothetical protein YPPY100_2149, partial [Yersinia pestis PY-100]